MFKINEILLYLTLALISWSAFDFPYNLIIFIVLTVPAIFLDKYRIYIGLPILIIVLTFILHNRLNDWLYFANYMVFFILLYFIIAYKEKLSENLTIFLPILLFFYFGNPIFPGAHIRIYTMIMVSLFMLPIILIKNFYYRLLFGLLLIITFLIIWHFILFPDLASIIITLFLTIFYIIIIFLDKYKKELWSKIVLYLVLAINFFISILKEISLYLYR